MSRVVLHIGLHKTGTTALQSFFAAQEAAFARHGVHFPQAAREKRRGQIIHSNLSWELLGHDLFDPALGRLDDLAAEIHARPERTWLITGEGLSRLPEPEKLLARFRPLPVTVVAYFRDPLAAAPSLYSEHLKAGSHLTFNEWIAKKATRWLDRATVLRPWRRAALTPAGRLLDRIGLAGGRCAAPGITLVERSLEKDSLHGGQLPTDFLQLLGLPAADFDTAAPAFSNPRISALECLGLVFLNTLQQRSADSDAKKIKDRLALRRALTAGFPGRLKPFEATPAQQATLARMFGCPAHRQPPPAAAAARPDELLDWLRAFTHNGWDEAALARARRRAALFAAEQAASDPFPHSQP